MSETGIPLPLCDTSTPAGPRTPGLTRRALLSGAAGLALTAAFGCGRSRSTDQSGSYSTVIVTAFDISSSTNMADTRQRYFEGFQGVVNDITGDARVDGYPITGDTEATSMARISEAFPAFNPLEDNADQHAARLAQARADAISQANTLLAGLRTAPATDLLNAFNDAAKVFNGDACRGATDRRLIVFTDAIQQAGKYDFLRENITASRINQIIAAQRAAGQIPSLAGVKVWIAGATADPEGRIPPDKIAQILSFWIAFFGACGASLTPERYATTLMNYP